MKLLGEKQLCGVKVRGSLLKISPETSVLFDVAAPVFICTAGNKPTGISAIHWGHTLNLVPSEAEHSIDSEPPKWALVLLKYLVNNRLTAKVGFSKYWFQRANVLSQNTSKIKLYFSKLRFELISILSSNILVLLHAPRNADLWPKFLSLRLNLH